MSTVTLNLETDTVVLPKPAWETAGRLGQAHGLLPVKVEDRRTLAAALGLSRSERIALAQTVGLSDPADDSHAPEGSMAVMAPAVSPRQVFVAAQGGTSNG